MNHFSMRRVDSEKNLLTQPIVEKYLSITVEKVAKHYGVTKKSKIVMAFKQMGFPSSEGNFNLYKSG